MTPKDRTDSSDLGGADGSDEETAVIAELEDDAPRQEVLEFDDLGDADGTGKGKKGAGWSRVFRGNKGLWVSAVIAIVALIGGLLIGHFITSPADAANNAKAPDPGLITVPVEYGKLSNDVTIRSDISFADSVDVKLDTSSFSGGAIVTGQVPAVGAELKPLSIVAEISGRPVFVLPGDLPSYRTLRIGVSGPDVLQLKQALASLGIAAGDVANNVFDQALADGIAALYAQVGYPLPPNEEGADENFRAAQQAVTDAQTNVNQAQSAYDNAASGTVDPVALKQADNAVAEAQRAVDDAEKADPYNASAVASAKDNLALQQLIRDQLFADPDASNEWAALESARSGLTSAQESLADAREAIQPYLPSSEVLYLTQLPRLVNAVNIARGSAPEGVAMSVSGASLELSGSVAAADGKLLTVGTVATFAMPDDSEHTATITKVEPGKNATDRWAVTLEPAPFTPEQIQQVQGSNVRVQIPVGATEGDVLSVPPSALTAGPGGESRVEVAVGDPRDGDKAETRLVTVETGLAAGGYVEVKPIKGELEKGDLVVVGS
ncbi:hypothetical protein [Microbacterium sp. NC79]|uniref:hypothetical protein n=1 Tax=Microbacterium sp. NC79 TaxID=2851009 RepID=UPI001C2C11A4|nr:hypothetical protein [Microbacterium sp. NC79]MBV0893685.1 hypothetical protein [Microbacterium sp. NC79]